MLIHSVAPLQMLMSPPENTPTQIRSCKYGFVEGVPGQDGFIISRIISTDPHAYLDQSYSPGSKIVL